MYSKGLKVYTGELRSAKWMKNEANLDAPGSDEKGPRDSFPKLAG